MALLTVLIVAMMTQANAERAGAGTEFAGNRALLLADAARNLVLAQIRQGTSVSEGRTWISQPGAIRQFDQRIGPANEIFKLYSAPNMTVPGVDQTDADLPPADWRTRPHEWVDLNAPVFRDTTGNGTPDRYLFPIVDPTADVEGFALQAAPGASANNPAPMPVRWLYFLRNGDIVPATPSGEGMRVNGATADNPVIGRIAFWTDDESAKVNINSATEPTPWDLPRVAARTEFDNAWHQPANREYQRYPAHPMMTALSPVLFPNQDLAPAVKEQLYAWLPRSGTGGTQAGTVRIGNQNFNSVTLTAQRLYDSTDELLMLPSRQPAPLAVQSEAERKRFFLTANSRAPELNQFGLPRVSVWPSHILPARRTPLDGLLRFCSTIGPHPFYFQRSNNLHPTQDWTSIPRNQQLYAYLQNLTQMPIPGYGGATLAGRWGQERDQILTQVFDYIRSTNLNDPLLASGNRFAPSGHVTPIRIGDTMGFGRQYMLSQLGLLFICNAHGEDGVPPREAQGEEPLSENERRIQACVLFEAMALSPGFHELRSEPWSMRITGAQDLTVDGQNLGFPASMDYTKGGNGFGFPHFWHNRHWGSQSALRATILRGGGGNYHLRSPNRVVVNDGGDPDATMTFSGGSLTVQIYHSQNPNDTHLVQTLTIVLPPAEFPIPQLVRTGSTGGNNSAATGPETWHSFENYNHPDFTDTVIGRFSRMSSHPHMPGELYADVRRRWPGNRDGGPTGSGIRAAATFRPEDTLRTLTPFHGDIRLAAAQHVVDASVFRPNAHYFDPTRRLDHLFSEPAGTHLYYGFGNEPGLTAPDEPGTQLTDAPYHWAKLPVVPQGAGVFNRFGDFDTAHGHVQDGAWINKPDEGNTQTGDSRQTPRDWPPYFFWNPQEQQPVHFSPNRIIPGPGMLGSLPTGVKAGQPWQTLLFRPEPGHPGAQNPPDHLLLDLLWMPVVEPFALSERFSTAGKVNLNYRIEPFNWIQRTTGLHSVLKSEEPMAVRNEFARASKLFRTTTHDDREPHEPGGATDPEVAALYGNLKAGNPGFEVRKPISLDATLEQFERRFDDGRYFVSPTELCEVHLVREGESLAEYESGSFWNHHVTTGDNVRERPYANILPRVTTRSNTFRIHYRVQALNVGRTGDPRDITPDNIRVTAETRGSTLVERYLDPDDPVLETFDPAATLTSLEPLYNLRVIRTRRFP